MLEDQWGQNSQDHIIIGRQIMLLIIFAIKYSHYVLYLKSWGAQEVEQIFCINQYFLKKLVLLNGRRCSGSPPGQK